MSWHWPPSRENHPPGKICHTTIKFSVDKISDSPQTQADWSGDNDEVHNLPERFLIPPGERDSHDQHTDQPSVKGHSPAPDSEDLKGIGEIHLEIVKEDIPQTGANHQPNDEVEVEVFHLHP